MITFEDCLGLCGLTQEEISAIAEHEHLPEIVALALGSEMARSPDGQLLIGHIIIDDILAAERRGDLAHASALKSTLRQLIKTHIAGARPAVSR